MGPRHSSVRRLAEHPDCPLSRSGITRALEVFVAMRELGEHAPFVHIQVMHVSKVANLPAPERLDWLIRADTGRWSVRKLAEELIVARREDGEGRGRPKGEKSPSRKAVHLTSVRILEDLAVACKKNPADTKARQAFDEHAANCRMHLAEIVREVDAACGESLVTAPTHRRALARTNQIDQHTQHAPALACVLADKNVAV